MKILKLLFVLTALFTTLLVGAFLINTDLFDEEKIHNAYVLGDEASTLPLPAPASYNNLLELAEQVKGISGCNPRFEISCLEVLKQQIDQFDSEVLASVLARYEQLIFDDALLQYYIQFDELSYWLDASNQIAYHPPMILSVLWLASRTEEQPIDTRIYQEQLNFWGRLYKENDMLISKMVAMSGLWSISNLTADHIKGGIVSAQQMPLIQAATNAAVPDPSVMARGFDNEYRYLVRMIDNDEARDFILEGNKGWFSDLFLQPNATANLFWRLYIKPAKCISTLPAARYLEARKDKTICDQHLEVPSPYSLYNPFGKAIASSISFGSDYTDRVYDVVNVMTILSHRLASYGRDDLDYESVETLGSTPRQENGRLVVDCISKLPSSVCGINI